MSAPLADTDMEQLQELIVARMEREEAMPLDMIHGFFTATLTGPRDVDESDWLGGCLLGHAAEPLLTDLLRRFRAGVARDLATGDYGPLVIEMPRDDGSVLPLPYGWCQGYVMGLELQGEEAQSAMLGDEAMSGLLTPIFAFLMYDESQLFNPPNEAMHCEAVGELADSAVALYRWWQARLTA